MRKLSIIALAAVLLGISPMFAADLPSLHSIPRPFVPTTATSPGIIVNSITIGEPDVAGNEVVLPCFNCVPGASVQSLGLSLPLSLVPAGAALQIVLTADDVAYSGPVTFTYAIRATITSTPIQTGNFSTQPGQGVYPSFWLAYFPITIPTTPGRYILQGSIIQGDAKSVVNSSILIQ